VRSEVEAQDAFALRVEGPGRDAAKPGNVSGRPIRWTVRELGIRAASACASLSSESRLGET
jgi:hypothetical protein